MLRITLLEENAHERCSTFKQVRAWTTVFFFFFSFRCEVPIVSHNVTISHRRNDFPFLNRRKSIHSHSFRLIYVCIRFYHFCFYTNHLEGGCTPRTRFSISLSPYDRHYISRQSLHMKPNESNHLHHHEHRPRLNSGSELNANKITAIRFTIIISFFFFSFCFYFCEVHVCDQPLRQ